MTAAEDYLKEIICLQLKKPRNWNWQLSASKSSPHITLPTIQLYNAKGKLLVQTKDNGTTTRQQWHGRVDELNKNLHYLQKCKSENVVKKYSKYSVPDDNVNYCPKRVLHHHKQLRQDNAVPRSRSDVTIASRSMEKIKLHNSQIMKRRTSGDDDDEKYELRRSETNLRVADVHRNYTKLSSRGIDPSSSTLFVERKKSIENGKSNEIYGLKKSKSDVLDIKAGKSNSKMFANNRSSFQKLYHKRTNSDDLLNQTRRKYNLKESLRRAEIDGYKKFLCNNNNNNSNDGEKDTSTKTNQLYGRRGKCTAETIYCDNSPAKTIEITNLIKPRRYRLRKSRAGILVLSDESCSSSHRRRCHGNLDDCRNDNDGDIIIEGDLSSSIEDFNELKQQQLTTTSRFQMSPQQPVKSTKGSNLNISNSCNHKKRNACYFRQSSDSAGVKTTSKFLPNQYCRQHSTQNSVTNSVNVGQNASSSRINNSQLFHSKSEVFSLHSTDQSSFDQDYIVQEPLTRSNSESKSSPMERYQQYRNKWYCSDRSTASSIDLEEKLRKNTAAAAAVITVLQLLNESMEDGSESNGRMNSGKAPKLRATKSSTPDNSVLLELVRRLSSASQSEQKSKKENDAKFPDKCHMNGVMGSSFSRYSTKGLSGRRSQSSGSICNGKGRHQGDGSGVGGSGGSGKGSGGSLPNYLDERDSASCNNNYQDESERASSDVEGDRIPPLGNGAQLHWKFSDTQTALCQDQGYGSERSPEEDYPPPLPEHDLDEYQYHLEPHSCFPFITPETTFTVKLIKGPRGLGLSVAGGTESTGSWPGLVRIKRLFPHQPASSCGLLNVGDLLLEANGVALTGLTNYEALEVLRTASHQVELKVCRPPPEVINCVSPISEVPPPPPMRKEPPNSLNISSTVSGTPADDYYHGEFELILTKVQGSLGFTLRKEDDSALGHYVKALVREPALSDGRINPGDRIISVNDVEISGMTHDEAVNFLRQLGDTVKLRFYRDSAQTPVAALSPTETTPRASFSRKANFRQEAVDMLNDIAVRKLIPQQASSTTFVTGRRSTSPRRLRRHNNYPSDASSQESQGTKYVYPATDEQFHEGMLKCTGGAHFDEDAFNSLFSIESEEMDRPLRPSSLDLYNPNQTPVASRKPRFNFSLAHNAYELNNLDPEVLDAPNLTYNLGNDDCNTAESEAGNNYNKEPASMPHIPLDNASTTFSYKNPTYQSVHPPCTESTTTIKSNIQASSQQQKPQKEEETDTIKRKKGILKKDTDKRVEKLENKTEPIKTRIPIKEDYEILSIELNRGWNSRLGFSLQGAAGVTYVSAVHSNSVAAKDGRIKPGDLLVKVNDESVEHLNTNEIIDLLRIVRGPVCIVVKRIRSNEDCPKSNAEN